MGIWLLSPTYGPAMFPKPVIERVILAPLLVAVQTCLWLPGSLCLSVCLCVHFHPRCAIFQQDLKAGIVMPPALFLRIALLSLVFGSSTHTLSEFVTNALVCCCELHPIYRPLCCLPRQDGAVL